MEKQAEAFRTISEAADALKLPQHVLRFWETKFPQIKPMKRGGGRRYYRPDDVLLLAAIQRLLYDDGYTIKGVQRILKDQGAKALLTLGKTRPGGVSTTVVSTPEEKEFRGPIPAPEQMPLTGFDPAEDSGWAVWPVEAEPQFARHPPPFTDRFTPPDGRGGSAISRAQAKELENLLGVLNGCIAILDSAET